jgi:hypothetical protein
VDGASKIEGNLYWQQFGPSEWAEAAQGMLDDMRTPREREILVGLYRDDGKGTQIRRELGWSHWQLIV